MSLKCMIESGVYAGRGLLIVIIIHFFIASSVSAQAYSDELERCRTLEDDDPSAAVELATTLLQQIDKQSQAHAYAQALGCLGWSLAATDQLDAARQRTNELESLSEQLSPSQETIQAIRRAGSIFHRLGDRIAATENYSKAMDVATELDLKAEQIPLLVNLGVLHSEIREHDQAIKDYYLALELMDELEDYRYQVPTLFNLGITLSGQKRPEEALTIFRKMEPMMNDQWPASRRASVQSAMGAVHMGLKDYPQALIHFEEAMDLYADLPDTLGKMTTQTSYAEALVNLELADEAKVLADAARDYFVAQDQVFNDGAVLYNLADVYEALGDQENALELLRMARRKDVEFNKSFNQETMAQMQARLADSQQQRELADLKNENTLKQMRLDQVQKQRWLWLIAGGLFIVILSSFMLWQNRMNRKLQTITRLDTLTQMGNRRAIEHWRRERLFPNPPTARLMWLIDLDHFKNINDSFGHDAGDFVLKKVAAYLQQHIEKDRFVCRWGGEEFMFLTEDIALDDLNAFADTIRNGIADLRIELDDNDISITASIGVSQIENSSKEAWNQALAEADTALYQAKDQGRNQTVSGIVMTA